MPGGGPLNPPGGGPNDEGGLIEGMGIGGLDFAFGVSSGTSAVPSADSDMVSTQRSADL